jgi:deazaflavin-dependent oxidoreductase (nitroreductase family)
VSSWARFAADDFCYVTTRGRRSGRPHRIEIWFALEDSTVYLLSGGRDRADWVRNLVVTPEVTVEIGGAVFAGRARVVTQEAEDERARALVHDKYAPGYPGDLSRWRRAALPVAIDLDESVSAT